MLPSLRSPLCHSPQSLMLQPFALPALLAPTPLRFLSRQRRGAVQVASSNELSQRQRPEPLLPPSAPPLSAALSPSPPHPLLPLALSTTTVFPHTPAEMAFSLLREQRRGHTYGCIDSRRRRAKHPGARRTIAARILPRRPDTAAARGG
jgi:hypothetical protein